MARLIATIVRYRARRRGRLCSVCGQNPVYIGTMCQDCASR